MSQVYEKHCDSTRKRDMKKERKGKRGKERERELRGEKKRKRGKGKHTLGYSISTIG